MYMLLISKRCPTSQTLAKTSPNCEQLKLMMIPVCGFTRLNLLQDLIAKAGHKEFLEY